MDTRIYLSTAPRLQRDGSCVGAIVGKNPGSACGVPTGNWQSLSLGKDRLLPTVKNIFVAAYVGAGKTIPDNAYIQVWNLFYLCDPNLTAALRALRAIATAPICLTETTYVPIVWYAWGGSDSRLNQFKARFSPTAKHEFFFDKHTATVQPRRPTVHDFAKHTQGMPWAPVIAHLGRIV
jgi:hypothetical protein